MVLRRGLGGLALVAGLAAPPTVRAQNVAMPGHDLRGGAAAARWNAFRLAGPSPTLAQMQSACAIGSPAGAASSDEFQYAGRGATPTTASGATTITASQANCLLQHFPARIFVADAAGEGALPESFGVAFAGRRYAKDETQEELERALSYTTARDKTTPILVYCHSATCGLSYYATQRVVAAGYTSVL